VFGLLSRIARPQDFVARLIIAVGAVLMFFSWLHMLDWAFKFSGRPILMTVAVMMGFVLATLGSACILFIVPPQKLPPALQSVDAFGPLICGLLLVWLPAWTILFGLAGVIHEHKVVGSLLGMAHFLLPIIAYFGALMMAAPVAYDELFVMAEPAEKGMTKQSLGGMFLISVLTAGLFGISWFVRSRREMVKNFNADIPPSWHLIVPILNLIWFWKWSGGVQTSTGGKLSQIVAFLLCAFLGIIGMLIVQNTWNSLGGPMPAQAGGYPGGGYPPQGGGYPPQGGGYPPQGGGYPPQQGGWQ
jgi:hypothetical protein